METQIIEIPIGMDAEIKDGKIIIKQKESDDEKIRRWLSDILDEFYWRKDWPYTKQQVINYLEKQKEHISNIDAICLSAGIPKSYKDGNQWCILKGDDIQEGVAGFGNTQEDALVDFIRNVLIEKKKESQDGDFARGYDCGYQCCLNSHGAEWFEKQKEQPNDAKSERVIKAARRVLNNWLYGTDCPDVSGDFAELEYAIREYDGEEKQKEPKPAEWSERDERLRSDCINTINEVLDYERDRWEDYNPGKLFRPITKYDEQIDWLKSLRPQSKQEWSEEDERILKGIIGKIDHDQTYGVSKVDMLSFLKSIRPQPHWKPSEEQMGALNYAYCELFKREDVGHNILGPLQNLIDTLSKITL